MSPINENENLKQEEENDVYTKMWFKLWQKDWLSDKDMIELCIEQRLCYFTMMCYASMSDTPGTFISTEDAIISATHFHTEAERMRAIGCIEAVENMGKIGVKPVGNRSEVTLFAFLERNSNAKVKGLKQKRYREREKSKVAQGKEKLAKTLTNKGSRGSP